MATHVYHWRHGWIPLTHTAALQKAKGNHDAAARMLKDAHGPDAGIRNRRDVAHAVKDLPNVPAADRAAPRSQVQRAAEQHGAHDLLPSSMRKVEAPKPNTSVARRSNHQLIVETFDLSDKGHVTPGGLSKSDSTRLAALKAELEKRNRQGRLSRADYDKVYAMPRFGGKG